MKHHLTLCLALALVGRTLAVLGEEVPSAKPEDVGMSSTKLAHIGPAVQALVDKAQVPGAVIMVARHGKIIYCESFGDADAVAGTPMKRDEIVRIYSMTKPVTSVAVMTLVEAGKVDLDAPVVKYLPEFKDVPVFVKQGDDGLVTEPAQRAPTVRDLLRHTGGLTYGFMGNTPIDQAYTKSNVLSQSTTLAELTQKISKIPLLYQPGTKWNYSASADVLARLVEVVSGESFDACLQKRIFAPLDMRDTGFYVPSTNQFRFAAVHTPDNGKLKILDLPVTTSFSSRPTWLSGGGGLVSTARDYMRFCQMLTHGGELDGRRLLKPETVRAMTTNQLPPECFPIAFGGLQLPGVGFGLGFSVQVEPGFLSAAHIGEYGWSGLASTVFWISPKDDLVVIELQQMMPYSIALDLTVKPLVYDAITD